MQSCRNKVVPSMFNFIKIYWRQQAAAEPGVWGTVLCWVEWAQRGSSGERRRVGECRCARGGPMNRGWGDNWRGTIQIQKGVMLKQWRGAQRRVTHRTGHTVFENWITGPSLKLRIELRIIYTKQLVNINGLTLTPNAGNWLASW